MDSWTASQGSPSPLGITWVEGERGDMWEVAVWEDALATDDREVYLTYQVHNEAIVIPETIDAIRALTGIETDWVKSVEKTNASLGIMKSFLPRSLPEKRIHAEMAKRLEATQYKFASFGFKGAEEPEY